MLLELHFTEYTLALKFFLQCAQRLIDVIVANTYLHVVVTTFLGLSCKEICRTLALSRRNPPSPPRHVIEMTRDSAAARVISHWVGEMRGVT